MIPAATDSASTGQRDQHASPTPHDSGDDGLETYIQALVDQAPPLSTEQRDKLALLLNSHCRTR